MLAVANDMKIVRIAFDHKDVYKLTWISPNVETRNQIDYVLVEKKFKKAINDVRSYRGADTDSNQFWTIAELKQDKLLNHNTIKGTSGKSYDFEQLKDRVREKRFVQEMSKELQLHVRRSKSKKQIEETRIK